MRILTPIHNDPAPALQTIEVSSAFQIPSLQIVGLPSQEVREARERVRSAIDSSDLEFPKRRLVVNLSPAYIRKSGTGADLAIALAILHHSSKLSEHAPKSVCAVAELGLSGELKATGQLTRTVFACAKQRCEALFISEADLAPALKARQLIQESGQVLDFRLEIIAARNLREAWEILQSLGTPTPTCYSTLQPTTPLESERPEPEHSWSQLIPPGLARSLLIAATGSHHLLLLGAKGTGKSTAAEMLAQILPKPNAHCLLENQLIHELATSPTNRVRCKPGTPVLRVPSSVRASALHGRFHGDRFQPGAFAMAHSGVLVADELPEWSRDARESLREPLERQKITLHRARGQIEVPANFLFIATANLCPCGEFSPLNPNHSCRCRPGDRTRYLARLSGPILDRIDLVSLVENPTVESSLWPSLGSLQMRVQETRSRILARFSALPGDLASSLLEEAYGKSGHPRSSIFSDHSLRGRHQMMRVALTLAFLDGAETPNENHLFEAGLFRSERWLRSHASPS